MPPWSSSRFLGGIPRTRIPSSHHRYFGNACATELSYKLLTVRKGIEILTHHSFHSTSPTTSKAALQCLANALLAKPCTRQMFVDLGYSERAVGRLKKPKKDDEFLMSRILFLTTYGTTQSFEKLIDKHHLADHINDVSHPEPFEAEFV